MPTFFQPLNLHNNVLPYRSHAGGICLACTCTDCMCLHACARVSALHVHVGGFVHFDAQFKVRWHYLFMPLLFLRPPRVKNPWRSILGRSQRTLMQAIATRLLETLPCTHPFRRRSLSSLFCTPPPPPTTTMFPMLVMICAAADDGGTFRLLCTRP